jgi:hypothetical protein
MAEPGKFAHSYHVELLCQGRPNLPKRALLEALAKRCPGAAPLDGNPDAGVLHFAHPNHQASFGSVSIPAQILIAERQMPPEAQEYEPAIRQSWQFPEARDRVKRLSAAVVVIDQMASSLPRQQRLELFQDCVAATLEVVPCEAICWVASQRLVDPQVFLAELAQEGYPRLFAGAINVRLFNVAGATRTMVMDTLGLAAFGLPDIQCHFQQLDPNAVAPLLYDAGLYLFNNGDVIADGNTVSGVPREAKWRCRHATALVGPERTVLDLRPEPPYAVEGS